MCQENTKGCGCNDKDDDEKCCGGQGHDHANGEECCGGNGHDHEGGCGCGNHDHDHDHEHHQSVTLTLEDDTELECPVVDAFEVNEQSYIALLHPIDENVLLYRFEEIDDETIDIVNIESDEEFELASKAFMQLQEEDE